MLSEAGINIGIVAATCILLLTYLIRFVLTYKHKYESVPLCTVLVIICLLVVFTTAFVLPVDIFLVSFAKTSDGQFKSWATNETMNKIETVMTNIYISLYAVIMFLIFVVIPFVHFFIEESISNSSDRLVNAIKASVGFSIIMIIFLVLGAVVRVHHELDPDSIFNKLVDIKTSTHLQDSITCVLIFLSSIGFLNVIFYTASGIFSWPVGLIMGTSSVSRRLEEIDDREVVLRTRITSLREKSRASQLSPREQDQLHEAECELVDLEREHILLNTYGSSIRYKLHKLVRPGQIILGSVFILLSIFLIVNLIMVNLDRILSGSGFKTGYMLLYPTVINPLDYVYSKVETLAVIGVAPLLVVTCFLVVATISGMRNLGLWFMCHRIYRIKTGRTQPQALLFFCVTFMLTALCFNLLFYSMTSDYVTFGSQTYADKVNGTEVITRCTLGNYKENQCRLSRGSVIILRMFSFYLVGTVAYWMSWCFVLVGTVSMVAYFIRGRRGASHGLERDDDEEFIN